MALQAEQVQALAPDQSTLKAGRQLAIASKWLRPGSSADAIWGEHQGSGKSPYRTAVDLHDFATSCSCPSRKFPCKHAMGLLLLYAEQPATLPITPAPDWVMEWLARRRTREQQRATAAPATAAPPDTEAQAKRTATRHARVAEGLDDLDLWLRDLVRQGLANVPSIPPRQWDERAARLVDAQAPGVARMVRQMAALPKYREGWEDRLLEQIGQLYLLIQSYRQYVQLDDTLQAELRRVIGWTVEQSEVLELPSISDTWLVLGRYVTSDDKLKSQMTWLWGQQHQRAAYILQYAHGAAPLDRSLIPGTALQAELVYYPASYPLRAAVKRREQPAVPIESLPTNPTINAALAGYAAALAQSPWLEAYPLGIAEVIPVLAREGRLLVDPTGHMIPLAHHFDKEWELLALSGGTPLAVFGEWDGHTILPLCAWAEGRFVSLYEGSA